MEDEIKKVEQGSSEAPQEIAETQIVDGMATSTKKVVGQAVEVKEEVIDPETEVPMQLLCKAFQNRFNLDQIPAARGTGVTLRIVGTGATVPADPETGIPLAVLRNEFYCRLDLMLEEVISATIVTLRMENGDPNYRKDVHGRIRLNAPDDLDNFFESWIIFGGPLAHIVASHVIDKLMMQEKKKPTAGKIPAFVRAIVALLEDSTFGKGYNVADVLKEVISFGQMYANELLKLKDLVLEFPDGAMIIAIVEGQKS